MIQSSFIMPASVFGFNLELHKVSFKNKNFRRRNPVPADLCHAYEFENICKFSKSWHAIESWWVSQTEWKNGQEEFSEKEVALMAWEKKSPKGIDPIANQINLIIL